MKRTAVLFFFVLISVSISESWTSKTHQIVVVKSVKLMPATFRSIMLRHKEEILTGCLRPDDSGEGSHRYDLNSKTGFLQDRITQLTDQIPAKVRAHRPFREIAVDFGRLSHYVADLIDPLLLSDLDPREPQYREDFAIYLEKNIDQFPWVFDGHEHALLEKNQLKEYIYEIASNAARKYPQLGSAYFPAGSLVSSDTFDWKSLPFGIASLSFSRSISHTVQLWFYSWKRAHGDVTYTPLYRKQK